MPPLPGQVPLADFVTWNDAKIKMRYAAEVIRVKEKCFTALALALPRVFCGVPSARWHVWLYGNGYYSAGRNISTHKVTVGYGPKVRARTGQPFFLVTGIKRPHLNWRSPVGYASMYPTENVSVPTQLTLDKSIDPVAYSVFPMAAPGGASGRQGDFVTSPYVHGSDTQLRELRGAYYAAVSWADAATGQILDELDRLGLTTDTAVVLHSDHGWHLGEYAMWEKRTNWELGTRVPLIMRVPWLTASVEKRSRALVELVDVYQTLCDVVGVPLPPNDTVPFDGVSLRPILEDPTTTVKDVALSTFPRCAHVGMPIWGARGTPGGADNTCLEVERTDFTWMGYTMRTDRWRYTEW